MQQVPHLANSGLFGAKGRLRRPLSLSSFPLAQTLGVIDGDLGGNLGFRRCFHLFAL
jgi:hypothetical protein